MHITTRSHPTSLWKERYLEGPFISPELQFGVEFHQAMKGVDLAFAREDIGGHALIVSQRFRQFCMYNGLNARFKPVFITDKFVQRWVEI